jgi:hypothetical protein
VPTKKNPSSTTAAAIIRDSARQRSRALVSTPTGAPARRSELQIRKLLTPAQVQEALEVSESWLKRSDIPFIKLGRLRRYDVDVVEAYVTARRAA